MNRWRRREIYTYSFYGQVIFHYIQHNEWDLNIYNNIDGPIRYYTWWNKSHRERQILYIFTYMWNLKNEINKWSNTTKQKQTHRYWEWTSGYQNRDEWGGAK